jgi:hypothetical protein
LEDFIVSGELLEDVSEHAAVHTPEEVADFAAMLKACSTEELIARFDPAQMNRWNVYGTPWHESGREYVLQFLDPFREFILRAAEANHAMLITIS